MIGQAEVPRAFGPARKLDWSLVFGAILLMMFGLAALFSVDEANFSGRFFTRQLFFSAFGLGLMLGISYIPLDFWQRHWRVLYWFNVALLLAVKLFGEKRKGAQRWLDVGPIDFQPSELGKVLFCLTLAGFLYEKRDRITEFRTYVGSLMHLMPLIVLVIMQPHLGGTIGLILIWASITLYAGVPWKYPILTLMAVLAILTAGFFSPKLPSGLSYMKDRIIGIIKPDEDSNAYQQIRAVITIGSGGLTGTGFRRGELTRSGFVPDQQTDFIFSVVGEESGLIGCVLVLAAFCFFFHRLWQASVRAPTEYGRMALAGILAVLSFHTVVNVGMNIGITPVVGLWLPFMSYGVTALWMCLICTGLALSVQRSG